MEGFREVVSLGDDPVAPDDDGADRDFPGGFRRQGFPQRFAHVSFVPFFHRGKDTDYFDFGV